MSETQIEEPQDHSPSVEDTKDLGGMYVWGQASYGQLGVPAPKERETCPVPVYNHAMLALDLETCSLGDHHTLFLTRDGRVYACGDNSFGQCGVANTKRKTKFVTRPTRVKFEARIVCIAAGSNHCAAVDDAGLVYTWGYDGYNQLGREGNTSRPQTVNIEEKCTLVACGNEHTVALTESGRLFSWGRGSEGQLGYGPGLDYTLPRAVELDEGVRVKALDCGAEFTMALTTEGVLLGWGCNNDGQLGNGGRADGYVPHVVRALEHSRVASVNCGRRHTAAITENGDFYLWGCNKDGQLGLGDREDRTEPVLMSGSVTAVKSRKIENASWLKGPFACQAVSYVACGDVHTLVVTQLGDVYSWGSNRNRQLGIGDKHHRRSTHPRPVLRGQRITRVFAGGEHSVAVMETALDYPLGTDFLRIKEQRLCCDLELHCSDDKVVPAHSFIFLARCPTLLETFAHQLIQNDPKYESVKGPSGVELVSHRSVQLPVTNSSYSSGKSPGRIDIPPPTPLSDGRDSATSPLPSTPSDAGCMSPTTQSLERLSLHLDSDSGSESIDPLDDGCVSPRGSPIAHAHHNVSKSGSDHLSHLSSIRSASAEGGPAHLHLPDVTSIVVENFLEFLYSDYIRDLSSDAAFELLNMLQTYQLPFMPRLQSLCQRAVCAEAVPDDFVPLTASTITTEMGLLVDNEDISDIMFMVDADHAQKEGEMIYAHKAVLYARAGSFCSELGIDPAQDDGSGVAEIVNLPHFISGDGFRNLLHYVYTGEMRIPKPLREEMFQISNAYTVPWLWQYCTRELRRNVTVDNSPAFLHLARDLDCAPIVQYCLQLLASEWEQLEHAGFDGLTDDDVQELHLIQFGKPMPEEGDEPERKVGRFRRGTQKIKSFFAKIKKGRKSRGKSADEGKHISFAEDTKEPPSKD